MKILFVVLIFLFILFLLLLIPAKVSIKFALYKEYDIKVSILGFNLPFKQEKEEKRKKKKSVKQLLKGRSLSRLLNFAFDVLKQIVKKAKFIIKHSKVERFDLDITVASDDAASTAIEYGAVCAVVYPLISLLLNYNNALKENINIVCDYNSDKPQLEFYGVVSVRLIYLLAVLSILPHIIKEFLKKG